MDRAPFLATLTLALGVFVFPYVASGACPSGKAETLYEDARRAFEEQRYDDSIALLRNAYECDPNRVYLANIARAYEESNRPKDALQAWRDYLAKLDDPTEKRATEGRISVLEKLVARLERLEREKLEAERDSEKRAASPRKPAPASSPRSPSPRISTGAAILVSASGVALATGVVLGLVGRSKHSSAVKESDVVRANHEQDTAESLTRAANWTFVGAAVLGTAGGIWIGLDLASTPSSARDRARVPAFVSLGGAF